VLAAKQAATIDHISGGRFGLNVVAGWNAPELGLFGAKMPAYGKRYEQAAEWTEIVKRLWTSEDEFDFIGDYYEVRGGYIDPLPQQDPGPALMYAGGSNAGRAFAARYSDITFVSIRGEDSASVDEAVESQRAVARDANRAVPLWTYAYVIEGETDEEAQAKAREIDELGDYVGADGFIAGQIATGSHMPREALRRLRRRMVQRGGGFPLVGSPSTIADQLQMLNEAGIDGVLLSWIDYMEGLNRFNEEVMPLLAERGLRTSNALAEQVR
jgi:alkanesulfonate monooxygenase SsuD/methylene tetrahydromethanopterin reductase-like flavin-dependent oxidoreductase (luciferase family)